MSRLSRRVVIPACVAAVVLLQGCNLIAYAPAMAGVMIQAGDRDLGRGSKYWSDIQPNGTYRVLRPFWVWDGGGPVPGRSPLLAFADRPEDTGWKLVKLPAGTVLVTNRVHYYSDGLNVTRYSYHAVLQNGPLAGSEVEITNLLKPLDSFHDRRGIDSTWFAPEPGT